MGFSTKHITILLYSFLAVAAFSFLAFEWQQLRSDTTDMDVTEIARQSVDDAFEEFQKRIFEFSSTSTDFANQVSNQLTEYGYLNNTSGLESEFWGVAVFQNSESIYWNGYISTERLDPISSVNTEIQLSRKRIGNVQFLESVIPIVSLQNSDTVYTQVITRLLLEQNNEINLGKSQIGVINPHLIKKNTFPVRISYSRARQDSVIHAQPFESVSGEFIALVFASETDISTYFVAQSNRIRTIRAHFILGIVFLFTVLITWVIRSSHIYLQFGLHIIFLGLLYYLQSPILSPFLDSYFTSSMIDALFLVIVYLSFYRLSKRRIHTNSEKLSSELYLLTALNGVFLSSCILFVLGGISTTITRTELNLFNQVLTSSLLSTIWIWVSGSALLILVTLFNSIFLTALPTRKASQIGIFASATSGLAIPLLACFILGAELGLDPTLILVSSLLVVTLLIVTVFQSTWSVLNQHVSLIRVLLVMMTFVALVFTASVYTSFDKVLLSKLETNSKTFEQDNEAKIRSVISELLNEAYTEVRSISLFSVSNFEQIIEDLIQDDWLTYSFSLQLIDKSGDPLAAYNTNLSVPQWTTDFRIDELIIPYEEERIRKENLRPILRNQPINTVNAEYSYFMRGWIPVYQSRRSENISGWILATLYQEIPELNRPFRSVVNATIQSPEETAFAFTEYENRIPTRSIVSGTLTSIPDYGRLPTHIIEQLEIDSVSVLHSQLQGIPLKERFIKTESDSIIRGAHKQISVPQILYVFLRVYFTTVIPFILILVLFASSKIWNTFSESRRIRDRLMDRSIIASIACLFLLIGATSFILESQNKSEVQEALRDQLLTLTNTLSEAAETNAISNTFLENITAVLGVDASLYNQGRLISTTTPPMYTQHLIPATIPWNIHQTIVSDGAQLAIDSFTIGDQEMLMGYQPWYNSDNSIAGIVAIPTFLKTPDYYSRLLSTTSYLLAFYSLIFTFLILIIGFISARITAPLETLESGLERIAAGDLNTRLKVHTNDEIGTLTYTYNAMAQRLKTLQNELATSEREAAWKQMAQQVAHEIKNPLTPMKLNLQHLERQLHQTGEELMLDKPRVSAITKSMIEQIEALNKIASDFSKFAKPSAQQFEEVRINELVASVVMMYSDDSTTITTEFAKREFIISGVTDELRRAMVNLIKNAQEATSNGGKIHITTKWNTHDKSVEIIIADDGIGITEIESANIFLPNFSTKTSGTGLGLAITKKIIEEHSGKISFESTPGKGTTFTISIPLKNS